MKLKTIIVDDEKDALNFIESIIKDYCPQLEVVGTADSAKKGIKIINEKKPDLVFLDVEMPRGSGFDLLSSIPDKSFDVIFVTAFNHYAVKAIKFSAVDYILKPINISEFIQAINKVMKKRELSQNQAPGYMALLENINTRIPKKLAIPTSDGMEYLNTEEIIRIEAEGSYCRFYLTDGRKFLVSKNLKKYQELLTENNFFRAHNSHLVNLYLVKKFIRHDEGLAEMVDGAKIPIARGKRELFLSQMSKISK